MQSVALRGPLPLTEGLARTPGYRNGSTDALRFAAALVIVLFHAKLPVGGAMAAAMGVFTTLLACHAAAGHGSVAQVLRSRFDRMIRPFAVWAAIYAALRMADAIASGRPVMPDLLAWLPPHGTMGQLWYLPFAFAVCVGIALLRRIAGPSPGPILSAGFAVVGSLLWVRITGFLSLPAGLQVLVNFLPSVLFGIALASMPRQRGMMALLSLAAVATGLAMLYLGAPVSEQLWIGVPLTIAAQLRPVAATPLLRRASDLSMTIYLVHPLVIAVLLRLTALDLAGIAFCTLTLIASISFASGLTATRIGRLLA
jgi:surface polysaccharide O-acyltransferase-like enzyme